MKHKRIDADCSTFTGKIIVSGGKGLKPVESFDHHENKWTHLPDMLEIRKDHGVGTKCLWLLTVWVILVKFLISAQRCLLI